MTAILPSSRIIRLAVFERPLQHSVGLMGVGSMPRDYGALFVFPQSRRQRFWTFNCLFPLDIVWLDDTGRVVEVASAPPCAQRPCPSYGGNFPARYVLELNGGVAQQNGLVPGAQVALA